jgi:hypothetical protein
MPHRSVGHRRYNAALQQLIDSIAAVITNTLMRQIAIVRICAAMTRRNKKAVAVAVQKQESSGSGDLQPRDTASHPVGVGGGEELHLEGNVCVCVFLKGGLAIGVVEQKT